MIWVPVHVSRKEGNPNYVHFRGHLVEGWLFGRLRDNSDFQYRSFRDYIPALVGIMGVYLVLSWVCTRRRPGFTPGGGAGYNARTLFLACFTAIFITALHGANTVKLLALLGINYALAHAVGGKAYLAPGALWTFNISALALVHWNDGVPWTLIAGGRAEWADELFNGLLPRWQINFNISMLRMVSYGLDLHWARCGSATVKQDQHQGTDTSASAAEEPLTNRTRSRRPHPLPEYTLPNYLLYILYPPLFIAGPIMTFNDFHSQRVSPPSIPLSFLLRYTFRFLISLFTMEVILHYMYVVAIKDTQAWHGFTPLELSMVGFWNLIIVWLKLLLPWRFFRLWALADGVDPLENMIRCMANNYSTLGFWRSWHRSYNLWIIRYIYIPVGGSRMIYGIPATLLVFTFVALWHDLSLKLLTWGWLVTAFIIPELVCKFVFRGSKHQQWYRHLAAFGAVFNILLMMTANLVGFAIGVDGIKYFYEQLLGTWSGIQFMIGAIGTLFVGAQVMFEYRNEEARRGIYRKC